MSIPSIGTRAAWVVGLVLATGAATLAPVGVSASAPGDRAPSHWAGFRIPRNGHADGGWIGGYRVRGEPAFVTTPLARPNTRGYQAKDIVGNYREKKGATRSQTARAAWILSKYGGYRDATQAAAVDASVYHLLVGKRWRIDGDRGGRRIRQTEQRSTVRRFARIMLRQAAKSAGTYGVAIRSTGADVGGTVTGAVSVTDGKGAPVAGLPVTLQSSGADPVTAVTGDDGVALARFPAPVAGWQQISATVSQVPEHRLHLLAPKRRHQATAAVGGVRRTLTASTTAPVRGPQALSLRASADVITGGTQIAVTATVAGDGSARTATASLHGPFPSTSAASCTGPAVGTVTATVSADGSYPLPPLTPTAGGYYLWRVAVDGGPTSLPVAVCGASTKVRALTSTTIAAPSSASLGNVVAQVTVSGGPGGAPLTVTTTLFGPYLTDLEMRQDGCRKIDKEVTQTWPAGVVRNSASIAVDQHGYYAWQATTSPGDTWLGSRSTCLAANTTTFVP